MFAPSNCPTPVSDGSSAEVYEQRMARELIDNFRAFLDFDRLDRSGWFHCSDLHHKPGTVKFSPRRCVLQYLGVAQPHDFDNESAWAIARGSAVDKLAMKAIEASGWFLDAQPEFLDEQRRLRGHPDFAAPYGFDVVYGDVKATDDNMFRRYVGNPDWPLSQYYAWRQLQAYLDMSDTEFGFVIFFNAEWAGFRPKLHERICVRRYYRDETCIAGIRRDVAYLNESLEAYLAATTEEEQEAALPRW